MDKLSANTQPFLEFWFEFGSNYSYLSVMRIEELARQYGVAIDWKPFLLGPIFKDFGWNSSPFVVQEKKGRYVWRDMERQAEKYGLAFRRPSVFPRSAILPMRVALLGARETWVGAFCKNVMQQNWVEDIDINAQENVRRALTGIVADTDDVLRQAQGEENKLCLRMQTEEAKQRGIFGAPTFFVGTEMYWGDDRLEDAMRFASRQQA